MSNRTRIIGAGVALAGAALLVVQAGEMPHINVKLGLWEVHMVPQMSGDYSVMAQDQLANLPPEQRARMQAAMQALMTSMNKPRDMKECMTAEKLQSGFSSANQDKANCKSTVVTNSRSDFESKEVCASAEGAINSVTHFTAVSSDHVVGKVQMQIMRGGKMMNQNTTMEGKWLGADCGTVKDVELEKVKP
jgi:hypothetical protein